MVSFAASVLAGVVFRRDAMRRLGPRNRSRIRVLLYGDSITEFGYNVGLSGWVAILAEWWSRKADLVNRGFAGYNTRMAAAMAEDIIAPEAPDVMFLFFGANDAGLGGVSTQHVPLEEYESNLGKIIRTARAYNPRVQVVLIAPPPIWEPKLLEFLKERGRTVLDRENDNTKLYAEACLRVAEAHSTLAVDSWRLMEGASERRAEYLIDGIHLNGRGNEALSGAIREVLGTSAPHLTPEALPMHKPPWAEVDKDRPARSLLRR